LSDHTGFYAPIKPFLVMEITAITSKQTPVFHATVVGKLPIGISTWAGLRSAFSCHFCARPCQSH